MPKLIKAIKEGLNVVWSCDLCMEIQLKLLLVLKQDRLIVFSKKLKTFAIHQVEGSYAGGLHVEMTGQDVTEYWRRSKNF